MKAQRLLRSLLAASVLLGCQAAEPPDNAHILVLRGNDYERGFQHGQQYAPEIKSLYTRLLETSIIPYLNREQVSIAPVLPIYLQPKYLDGQFSYLMMLESGEYLWENFLPQSYKDEIQGIADGSGIDRSTILIMNTFFDMMMAFRSIVSFILNIQEPFLASVEFQGGLASDGVDNDGDGEVDEADEGAIPEYEASSKGAMVEVPTDVSFKLVFGDQTLPGLTCIDGRNINPLAEKRIEAACLKPECIPPENQGRDYYYRDDLNELALVCLPPRISIDCLQEGCWEGNDPGCVGDDTVRIRLDETLYVAGDPAITTRYFPPEPKEGEPPPEPDDCRGGMEVVFTPPEPLAPAQVHYLQVHVADQSPIYNPEPYHHRPMRDERIVFTTVGFRAAEGYGDLPNEIVNHGVGDDGTQPPAIGFAARGTATPDGAPILGQHFSLLDSDMVHEHSLVQVHVPDDGPPFVQLTWAGLTWGFAGMNAHGLSYGITYSDSLDNPLVGGALEEIFKPENLMRLLENPDLEGLSAALKDLQMIAAGYPIAMLGRTLLREASTVEEALAYAYTQPQTYGWNMILADAAGGVVGLELDSATQQDRPPSDVSNRDGFMFYTPGTDDPENLDPATGQHWAGVGEDDVRIASHFQKNFDDMVDLSIMQNFAPRRQRFWSGFYFRSLKAFYNLGDAIEDRYGQLDAAGAKDLLLEPSLVDVRDSMVASVMEPARQIVHWAMGEVPATDAGFVPFDFGAFLDAEGLR